MLGLLLYGELFLFFSFVAWEMHFSEYLFLGHEAPPLLTQNWLFLIGIVSAITGWIVSAYMTLRNSIKQHTISTLLQSRLSATYMENANLINTAFFAPSMKDDPPVSMQFLHDPANAKALQAVNYVLNYLEFLSVGIRHGDLDKKVLRHTMRGIVVRLYEKMSIYLQYMRGDENGVVARPNQLEHVTWLYQQWKNK